MKILGIGIDIVNNLRIKSLLKKTKTFKQKIFSDDEIKYCNKKKIPFSCYAKRFAAKEAFSKALGTGISNGLNFKEIEIFNNKRGKPSIIISGKSKKIVNKVLKTNLYDISLSISDDKPFAIATVLITFK